jgi:regulator of replication initiation timing
LQRTEAALAAETAARDKAERLLAETQNVVRDLRTKIGHAELAKNEAVDALRHERESIVQIRAETETLRQQLHDAQEQAHAAEQNVHVLQEHLSEERMARRTAEKALRAAELARETAEQLVRTLSEETPAPRRVIEPSRRTRMVPEPEVVAAPVKRSRLPEVPPVEPEPVKWWLNTKPTSKKR